MKESLNEKTSVNSRTDLDILKEIASGMKPGTLTVVGGRPGEGKTEFACCLADIISHLGKKSALFALGESRETLLKRFKPDDEMLEHNLFIDDTNYMTVSLMKQRIHTLGGVDCVIIDYLGLISPDAKVPKRSEEVAQITAGLKALAVEYDIPVVCFAQLSRDTEGNLVFRDSKAIVTDSDNVITLGRM
jgi:replicative DNA helicase